MSNRADVCLILEGTYPYVTGGVAAWTHDLIQSLDHLQFHLVTLLPRDEEPELRYALPKNVVGITKVHLQDMKAGKNLSSKQAEALMERFIHPFRALTTGRAHTQDLQGILDALADNKNLGSDALMDSEAAWNLVTTMYEASFSESSLLDYFWSWRALFGGLFSVVLHDLPEAKVYHALSTGYAGMLAARAKLETGKKMLLTEHGIYTNERRIEIASADWLEETASKLLTIDYTRSNLRDLWIDSFTNYSRIAYESADTILTLFVGNQQAQFADGATSEKSRIIPNGVDLVKYGNIERKEDGIFTVAMIGRVVPIKDVKSFLRATAMLRDHIPDIRVLILGGTDEDPDYYTECKAMVEYMALGDTVTFTGQVAIEEYLPTIDVLAFSSISEAQPLAILEAGACGIPTVATDVGACREIILGAENEIPALGHGGAVVPLGNPRALADEIMRLMTDKEWYTRASSTIRRRVSTYYDKKDQQTAYRDLYASLM